MASAMDGVVSPGHRDRDRSLGGLGVLNLEGIWTRYEDPDAELEEIAELDGRERRGGCRRSTPSRSSTS